MRDFYELLGVDADASKEEIEEAYRLRVVSTHRKGIWALGDRFRDFRGAYEVLADPERRAKYDSTREVLVLRGEEAQRKTARDRNQAARREGRIRSHYAKKIARDAFRLGTEATRENAPAIERLASEHDELEQNAARARRRREITGKLTRAALLLALITIAVVFALRR